MQVPSRKMIIAVIVDGHQFPELRHSDAKMCQDRLPTGAIAITDAIVRQENKIAFKPIQETIHKTMFTMQG